MGWAGALLSERLPGRHGALVSSPTRQKPGVMVHTGHPSTLGGEEQHIISHTKFRSIIEYCRCYAVSNFYYVLCCSLCVRENTWADRCPGKCVEVGVSSRLPLCGARAAGVVSAQPHSKVAEAMSFQPSLRSGIPSLPQCTQLFSVSPSA